MAITTIAGLKTALNSPSKNQTFYVTKAAVTNQVLAERTSYWPLGGFPLAGTTPTTTPAICHNGTTGSIPFVNPASGNLYLGRMAVSSVLYDRIAFNVVDRLIHMGGLVTNVITSQTAGISLAQTDNNFVERMGAADYSDVEWFIEVYAQTGVTGSTLTITYTNGADVGGQTTTLAWPASARVRRQIRILPANGDYIKSIDSIQFSVDTTSAGNIGITAQRPLTMIESRWGIHNKVSNWQELGFPRVYNSSCLQVVSYISAASPGSIAVKLELVNG